MAPRSMSLCIVTDHLTEARAFYEKHFDAQTALDVGSYVILRLGGQAAPELHLMQAPTGPAAFTGRGAVINLRFDEVEQVYERLRAAEVPISVPLEKHAWGDRGFAVTDPTGLQVYCFTPDETVDQEQVRRFYKA